METCHKGVVRNRSLHMDRSELLFMNRIHSRWRKGQGQLDGDIYELSQQWWDDLFGLDQWNTSFCSSDRNFKLLQTLFHRVRFKAQNSIRGRSSPLSHTIVPRMEFCTQNLLVLTKMKMIMIHFMVTITSRVKPWSSSKGWNQLVVYLFQSWPCGKFLLLLMCLCVPIHLHSCHARMDLPLFNLCLNLFGKIQGPGTNQEDLQSPKLHGLCFVISIILIWSNERRPPFLALLWAQTYPSSADGDGFISAKYF